MKEIGDAEFEYIDTTLPVYRQWHDDLGKDFLSMMLAGYERGKTKLSFQDKGKEIFVVHDESGEKKGMLTYSPKRGGPVKIYPISGTLEAQRTMIEKAKELASDNESHKLYTFAHEHDTQQIACLEEIGFTNRGKLVSPYKKAHNLFAFDLFVEQPK